MYDDDDDDDDDFHRDQSRRSKRRDRSSRLVLGGIDSERRLPCLASLLERVGVHISSPHCSDLAVVVLRRRHVITPALEAPLIGEPWKLVRERWDVQMAFLHSVRAVASMARYARSVSRYL